MQTITFRALWDAVIAHDTQTLDANLQPVRPVVGQRYLPVYTTLAHEPIRFGEPVTVLDCCDESVCLDSDDESCVRHFDALILI